MNYYGGTITDAGRSLLASLVSGEKIQFTKVHVGSGKVPSGTTPASLTTLVKYVAAGTSTTPTVVDGVLNMTIEYRNDLNGGLSTGFSLSEFGIYAKTSKSQEVLFYYATLGDSPQPVSAFVENRIDIRRFPISIAFNSDNVTEIQLLYSADAFVASKEKGQPNGVAELDENGLVPLEQLPDLSGNGSETFAELMNSHNTSPTAHDDIRGIIENISDWLQLFDDVEDEEILSMSEIIGGFEDVEALIKSLKENKVSVSDVINNLTTNNTKKPLSAAQGFVLKGLVDNLVKSLEEKADAKNLTLHTDNKSNPHSVTKFQIGLENVENKSSETIRSELTSKNVVDALGYKPARNVLEKLHEESYHITGNYQETKTTTIEVGNLKEFYFCTSSTSEGSSTESKLYFKNGSINVVTSRPSGNAVYHLTKLEGAWIMEHTTFASSTSVNFGKIIVTDSNINTIVYEDSQYNQSDITILLYGELL